MSLNDFSRCAITKCRGKCWIDGCDYCWGCYAFLEEEGLLPKRDKVQRLR